MDHPTAWGTVWTITGLLGFLGACYILGVVYVGGRKPMPSPVESEPYPEDCEKAFCSEYCYYWKVCPQAEE